MQNQSYQRKKEGTGMREALAFYFSKVAYILVEIGQETSPLDRRFIKPDEGQSTLQ